MCGEKSEDAETGNRVAQQLFVRGQATLSTAIRLYCAGKNGASVLQWVAITPAKEDFYPFS